MIASLSISQTTDTERILNNGLELVKGLEQGEMLKKYADDLKENNSKLENEVNLLVIDRQKLLEANELKDKMIKLNEDLIGLQKKKTTKAWIRGGLYGAVVGAVGAILLKK